MRAGALRDLIIWRKTTQQNVNGDTVKAFEDKTIKVYIYRNTGRKSENNKETFTQNTLVFKMWNHYPIKYSDLFSFEDNDYTIDNLSPSQDKRWLTVTISKKNN